MVATELLAASRQLLIVRPHACRADCPPDAADPDGVCMEQANRAICDVHWQYWEPCFPCNIQHHEPEHPTVGAGQCHKTSHLSGYSPTSSLFSRSQGNMQCQLAARA